MSTILLRETEKSQQQQRGCRNTFTPEGATMAKKKAKKATKKAAKKTTKKSTKKKKK
ncbi:MAG: hypothetical protein NDI63_12455 [Pseudobdellovibrio sp.]|uniref:hypothetical protein n=1 Tax=Pseudobdellovibrio sp. HCB154 TaxID=3386277 RepID=UPI0039176138|nr:hypothetical protein [Pseudobdellovibrio sp.]